MATLDEAFEKTNLQRAWRWLRSNPDALYKYFSGVFYSRFAIADDLIIDHLHSRLVKKIYEPNHSCKLLMPKKSGILRPYTLLTVEDQIVYQALANVIAERLAPRVRRHYLTHTFGHLYAGKSSAWFYKKWSDGYRRFNRTAREAFTRGLTFTASFDLTAFYDSVDHSVLRHFLLELNCDRDFCAFTTQLLSHWTATDKRIYQSHGIPQGPLSSGLVAEAVLQHFDKYGSDSTKIAYLRYVDDIRLFAKTELELRRLLIKLDQLSKDVGLFPQSSKIEIHEVRDIEEELKSVSNPTESALKHNNVDQEKLKKRIIQLSPRLTPLVRIEDETRFKFLLAHAEPRADISKRMRSILKGRPDLVVPLCRYFSKYVRLPRSVADDLITYVDRPGLYDFVTAFILDTIAGRLRRPQRIRLERIIKRRWSPRGSPDLTGSMGRALIRAGLLTIRQTEYALKNPYWWVRAELLSQLSAEHYGRVVLERLLNTYIRDQVGDVSLAAAHQLALLSLRASRPYAQINPSAGKALRQLGILRRAPGRSCGIEFSLARLTGTSSTVSWRVVFGTRYRQAEMQAVEMRALADTNVTGFVNAADVFNDLLLSRLYLYKPALGSYTLGRIGSVLTAGGRLRATYPHIFAVAESIHSERLKSNLSHPVHKSTGRQTGRIPYRYLKKAKFLYRNAINELQRLW